MWVELYSSTKLQSELKLGLQGLAERTFLSFLLENEFIMMLYYY